MIRTLLVLLSVAFAGEALAATEHHDLEAKRCRVFPDGNLQIVGISDSTGNTLGLNFSRQVLGESVIDRYTSICLTAVASGVKMRADYLDCVNGSCATTPVTSVALFVQ